MIEIQGVATDRSDVFPYSGIRVLGFIHVINGALIFCLGLGDLLPTVLNYDDDKKVYGTDYDLVVSLTVASSSLWCGIWFSVTGSLGTCVSRKRVPTLQFFKMAFLILNILCAGFFGPVCAVINGMIAMARHNMAPSDYQWLVTLTICFMAVLEIIISIATASITCCCSPLRGTQVHVMINQRSNTEQLEVMSAEKLNQSFPENASHFSGKTQDTGHVTKLNTSAASNQLHQDEARASLESRPPAPAPPHKFDGFGDSNPVHGSYSKLRKWALPHW